MNLIAKVLIMLSLLALMTQVHSYEPPIGIPDPGNEWGSLHPIDTPTPARPSDWSGEVSGYYYVDPSHSNATDSNNTYGYPNRPRSSIPNLSPGSYVELHGQISNSFNVYADCTEAEPCWITGLNENEMPTIPVRMDVRNGTYLFIEYLDFNGGTGGALGIAGASHHVAVRNVRLINRLQPSGNSTGIGMIPDLGETMENIVIYNNHMETLGDWTVQEDLDFHGMGISLWGRDSTTEVRKIWILENYCTLLSGDCLQINAGNWADSHKYLHHIYVGKNVSHKNRQCAVGVKQASDVIISQNKSSASYGSGGNAGGGVLFQYPKNRLWIIYNEIYDSVFGVRQSDTQMDEDASVYIIGNLIYDIAPVDPSSYDPSNQWSQGTAIALWHGDLNRYIVDNTIYDVYDGVNGIYSGVIEMYGNIISQVDNDADNHFFDITHPTRNDLVEMDYNLFVDDAGDSYNTWWDGVNRTEDLSVIKQAGHCGSCEYVQGDGGSIFLNPSSNPQNRNFNIAAGSYAIGNNVKHPAYDTFQSLYGMNIYVDFEGNPRPATSSSIGAFEFTNANFPPSPPVLNN